MAGASPGIDTQGILRSRPRVSIRPKASTDTITATPLAANAAPTASSRPGALPLEVAAAGHGAAAAAGR